jgi:sugar phosphate isomerase/epimerase
MAKVILSGFADEAANSKTAIEQVSVFAALGFEYYSLRFVDLGSGVKNVMALDDNEISRMQALNKEYGLKVCSIGSPLGKVKLFDFDDGGHNRYVPFDEYMRTEVARAIDLAEAFGTKLIRGFSFYPPAADDPRDHLDQAVEQIAAIADACGQRGVIYGLEVEANLIGRDGHLLAELHKQVNSPHMVTIFDGGNLSTQNMPPHEVYAEYLAMKDSMGWMHVKDYKIDPSLVWTGTVDEERLKNFVPCDEGDSGHDMIFRDLKDHIPVLEKRLEALGVPGVFLDLEPHLKGGGQFGGFSGPDGMGVALRALQRSLDYAGIEYSIRDFSAIRDLRGF